MSTGLWLQLHHNQTSTTVTLSPGTAVVGGTGWYVTDAKLGVASPLTVGLSRRGAYTPVQCEITCSYVGASADAVWGALDDVNKIMSLAALWNAGKQGIDPVLIRLSPIGSTTTTNSAGSDLTAVMLRPIGGGVFVDPNKPMRSSASGGYQLDGIKLTFERQGEWQYVYNSASGAERVAGSASATNTTIQLLSFTAVTPQHVRAPGGVALAMGTSVNSFNGLVAISSNTNSIQIANITYTGGNFATVADGRLPRSGGNAIRFTPADTTVNTTGSVMTVGSVDRPVFILSVRNNSVGGHQYRVRLRIDDGGIPFTYTTWRVIDDANTDCRHIVFPAVGLVYGKTYTVKIEVAASATGSVLDFNYVAHIDTAEYTTQMFRFGAAFGKMVIRAPLLNDDREMAAFEGSYTNDYNATSRTSNARALPILSGTPPWISADGAYMLAMVHSGGYWAQRTGANALDTIQYVAMRRRISVTPR